MMPAPPFLQSAARLLLLPLLLVGAHILFTRWHVFGPPYLPAILGVLLTGPAILLQALAPGRLASRVSCFVGIFLALLGLYHFLEGVVAAWSFTTDDAYITLRYARNWVDGHGIRFNPGENPPVEGYSNPPYLILGALGLFFGLDPAIVLKSFSLASAIAMFAVFFLTLRRFTGWILAGVGTLYLCLFRGSIWWTVSGLETAFYQLQVVAAFALALPALHRPSRRHASRLAAIGFLCFLAAWTRPEGVLLGGILLGALTVAAFLRFRRRLPLEGALRAALWRNRHAIACFSLPLAAFFAWRLLYYGRLVPNTVLCKADAPGNPWRLLHDFYRNHFFLIWIALLSLIRIKDKRILATALFIFVSSAILYGVDPVVAHHNRHFLGVLPLLAGLAMLAIAWLTERLGRWLPQLAPLPLALFFIYMLPLVGTARTADDAAEYVRRTQYRRNLAQALAREARDEDAWAMVGDAGIIPYEAGLNILDAYCLNSLEMTTPPVSLSPDRFAEYVLFEHRPELIAVHSFSDVQFGYQAQLGIWRAIVHRPEFFRDYELEWISPGDYYSTYWVFRRKVPACVPTFHAVAWGEAPDLAQR